MNPWTRTPFVPDRCFEHALNSRRGLEYRILISAPADAPPPKGYGVIFALDGHALFQTLAETVRLQTRKPKGYDPILVIGIGYPSREPFDHQRRCYDFTMPVNPATLPRRPDGQAWPPHGGADAFLDFLEQDLLPTVSEHWPIHPEHRLIVGHSLGGLFVLHAMVSRPHLFSHYVSGSPSVWWGNGQVLREIERFVAAWDGRHSLQLLLVNGAEELPDMIEGAGQAAERLQPLAAGGILSEWVTIAAEEHTSVLTAMLARLPRFLWSRPAPASPQVMPKKER